MRVIALLVLASSCKHPNTGPQKPHATGQSPTDSGVKPAVPRQPGGEVPPSATLVGATGMNIGYKMNAVSAFSGDPSVLILRASTTDDERATYGWPKTFLIPGELPRGETLLLDLWDGVSGHDDYYADHGRTQIAGDTNDDGHLDLWLWDHLYFGPLLGRRMDLTNSDASLPPYTEVAVAANFDADGDGHEDAVFKPSSDQNAYIRYGPFEGALPAAQYADPATYSTLGFGAGCHSVNIATVIKDHLGPGHDAVAVGADKDGGCADDGYIWDLQVPRGTHLDYPQAVAAYDGGFATYLMDDAGDVDGDGFGDIAVYPGGLLGYGFSLSFLLKGPVEGPVDSTDWPAPVEILNGIIQRGIGDINGDGQPELLGVWRPDPNSIQGRWMILFSPHQDPLDLTSGLELGPVVVENDTATGYEQPFDWHWDLGLVEADLDGDGLVDLIGYRGGTPQITEGIVAVWYSGDLLAAFEAQRAELD